MTAFVVSRRTALAETGVLLVSFALSPALLARENGAARSKPAPRLPGSLENNPHLDS